MDQEQVKRRQIEKDEIKNRNELAKSYASKFRLSRKVRYSYEGEFVAKDSQDGKIILENLDRVARSCKFKVQEKKDHIETGRNIIIYFLKIKNKYSAGMSDLVLSVEYRYSLKRPKIKAILFY